MGLELRSIVGTGAAGKGGKGAEGWIIRRRNKIQATLQNTARTEMGRIGQRHSSEHMGRGGCRHAMRVNGDQDIIHTVCSPLLIRIVVAALGNKALSA